MELKGLGGEACALSDAVDVVEETEEVDSWGAVFGWDERGDGVEWVVLDVYESAGVEVCAIGSIGRGELEELDAFSEVDGGLERDFVGVRLVWLVGVGDGARDCFFSDANL